VFRLRASSLACSRSTQGLEHKHHHPLGLPMFSSVSNTIKTSSSCPSLTLTTKISPHNRVLLSSRLSGFKSILHAVCSRHDPAVQHHRTRERGVTRAVARGFEYRSDPRRFPTAGSFASARRLTSEMSEEQGEDSEENTEAPATFIEAAFPSTPLGGENMPRLQEPSSPRPLDVQYRVDPTTQLNRPEWSLFCWIVRRS
jgi:hypothetical protein